MLLFITCDSQLLAAIPSLTLSNPNRRSSTGIVNKEGRGPKTVGVWKTRETKLCRDETRVCVEDTRDEALYETKLSTR